MSDLIVPPACFVFIPRADAAPTLWTAASKECLAAEREEEREREKLINNVGAVSYTHLTLPTSDLV